MFLVVVFSFLFAYLHVCVPWATLPELNKMNLPGDLPGAPVRRILSTCEAVGPDGQLIPFVS